MLSQPTTIKSRFFCWWGQKILRFPWILLILVTLLCGFSLQYTIENLGVNTDTSELLSPELPFQKNRFRWEKAFPQDASTILLVVESETPELSSIAAQYVSNQLSQQKDIFEYVYIDNQNPFFSQQGLLYLKTGELEDLAVKLTDAQPFIGHLAEHYSLQGLLEILGDALDQTDNTLNVNLDPLLTGLQQSMNSAITGDNRYLSWQKLLSIAPEDSGETYRHVISAKPIADFSKMMPVEQALVFAEETMGWIRNNYPGVTIRMTGEKALESDELKTLSNDTPKAGAIALLLVCLVMYMGLRSVKLVLATFLALIMGLVLTAGYAALVVGHLNVLSVAFAVLYIGLGVDFAIHICLHYRECREHHASNTEAIRESIQNLGFSLFLCALTTSIGFFAFIPTDYAGVSELGLISGGGMFIGLFISLTVLPALLEILTVTNPPHILETRLPELVYTFPFRHATGIRITSIILAIGATFLLTKLSFDSDPVNLRNPESESVIAFKDLLKSKKNSPFAVIALADDLENAEKMATKFDALPSVSQAVTLKSFVAENQQQKLEIIDDLNLILSTNLTRFNRPLESSEDIRQALLDFHNQIASALATQNKNASASVLQNLQSRIQDFLQFSEDGPDSELINEKLQKSILGLLPYTMNQLGTSLGAYPYGLDDLPSYIKINWVGPSGIYKILVEPEKDLRSVENLREFVDEVQAIDNTVTGIPVADTASGETIIRAFLQAFSGALLVITIVLLLLLRNLRKTLLVIWPLLLAGLLTGAANVLLDNPFNLANIIAMPLLMGMGVDSGIHIMHRLHEGMKEGQHLLLTSTARGVFFSSFTTLCSFTSLAFTSHAGIASMGLLLAVGISFTLICTLIVLPAFSSKRIPL